MTRIPCALCVGIALLASASQAAEPLEKYVPTAEALRQGYQRGQRLGPAGRVYKERITPHWFADNSRFWYRNDLRGGAKEFILVDAERGRRQPAFDHALLAAGLSKAAGANYRAEQLPFESIEFLDDGKALRFKVGDTSWKCDLASYECSKVETSGARTPHDRPQPEALKPEAPARDHLKTSLASASGVEASGFEAGGEPDSEPASQFQRRPGGAGAPERSPRSPDGKWTAFIKDYNLYLRPAEGAEIQLSQDGKEDLAYGLAQWSPDSKTLAAFRIAPGERKEVYLVESSPRGGGRAKLQTRPYALPGDRFSAYELNVFDVASHKQLKPEVDRVDFGTPRLRWKKDGRSFTYQQVDRGHQRFRVIEVDAQTGKSRNIIDEKSATFIWTAHAENVRLTPVNWLEKSDEIIYASERDGWRHLYLIDPADGTVKHRITQGPWVVRGIDRIDEDRRQIWFQASGRNPEEDPYFLHHYRVNFDGSDLVALTEGNGSHSIAYSPDRKYLIDTYSRVDQPPAHTLRRVADGALACKLEEADATDLKAAGWEPPEVFVAKGRDGTTDIWGIICRPAKLDPTKRYAVIEQIYAGPQGSFVPKTFGAARRFSALTDLGFIVVQMDGMGTANRSKAFHDACWKNLKDAGFPDRILWHQAAAKKYPYYDLSRVGIYGGSAGGQNAAGAVLFHPDFYKVAVASCGCHDNRMDKASWNEQWMGYPVGPQYSACSNIDNAHRLRGKLLLIVGEMDTNVPPESTLRLADALIKANKDFELLVVPGAGHGDGGPYGQRRRRDFFVRHLHGVEPPDWNGGA